MAALQGRAASAYIASVREGGKHALLTDADAVKAVKADMKTAGLTKVQIDSISEETVQGWRKVKAGKAGTGTRKRLDPFALLNLVPMVQAAGGVAAVRKTVDGLAAMLLLTGDLQGLQKALCLMSGEDVPEETEAEEEAA